MALNAVIGVLYAAVYSLSLFMFFASLACAHHSLTKLLRLAEHSTSGVIVIISETLNSRPQFSLLFERSLKHSKRALERAIHQNRLLYQKMNHLRENYGTPFIYAVIK